MLSKTMSKGLFAQVGSGAGATVTVILVSMTLVALLEAAIPPSRRNAWITLHPALNLALKGATYGTNAFFNAALVGVLVTLQSPQFGPLRRLGLGTASETLVVLLVLDFSFYLAHVAMHKVPSFWRFHGVHHSDPA